MTNLNFLMTLLPVVFMIHDFEELIMSNSWLAKNREELRKRFPKIEYFLTRQRFFELSTAAFSVAVAHEFLLITIVSLTAVFYSLYEWWFAAFMAFFLHLLVHIVQWAVFRKYIPAIVTSIMTMPYCIYTLMLFVKSSLLSYLQMLLWAFIGIVLMVMSFISAFYFANKFNLWERKQ